MMRLNGGDDDLVKHVADSIREMYTPFSGGMLKAVMEKLEREAARRTIRLFTMDPVSRLSHWWAGSSGRVAAVIATTSWPHSEVYDLTSDLMELE
jgi:hypothetical protein